MDFKTVEDALRRERYGEDPMYGGSETHYHNVGASALRIVAAATTLAQIEPASVLDFGCAAGRVTRWLRAAYPDADLHVADIDPGWMRWSAETFGATGWMSSVEIADLTAPRAFDVIWCGSVATHLTETRTRAMLRKFSEWLTPKGIAVVTIHGRRFVQYATDGTVSYFGNPDDSLRVIKGMRETGFGYQPHPGQDQGISAMTAGWITDVVAGLGCRTLLFGEHGWDDHQDVVVFQRD